MTTSTLALYEHTKEAGSDSAFFNLSYLIENVMENINKKPQQSVQLYERFSELGKLSAVMNLTIIVLKAEVGFSADSGRCIELLARTVDRFYTQVMHPLNDNVQNGEPTRALRSCFTRAFFQLEIILRTDVENFGAAHLFCPYKNV